MSGHGALAGVMTGWTGDITFGSDYDTTITPMARESVASLFARLVHQVLIDGGLRVGVSVDSTGTITLACEAPFVLVLTGNCAARTGYVGSYVTPANSQTAEDPYEQGWIASRGMRLDAPLWSTSGERGAVGDGSGATAPTRAPARARYVAWDSLTYLPDLSREYDYWHDGRLFGRFIVESARLVPLGITRTPDNITVEIDIGEVA